MRAVNVERERAKMKRSKVTRDKKRKKVER